MVIFYAWIGAAIAGVLLYLWRTYSKLSRAGVHHLPAVPFFGNMASTFLRQEHALDLITRLMRTFPDDKIVGFYELVNPILLIKDLDVLKQITVKDFEYFVDRRVFVDTGDPLFGRSLLLLNGDEWKAMRSTLSPAFTSSKIRLMVPFMVEVGEEMIKVLKRRIADSEKGHIVIEARDVCSRYACDVIASCAFGLKVNSQVEKNQFYNMSSELATISFMMILKIFVFRLFPSVAKFLKIKLSPSEASDFFTQVVLDTMKNRYIHNISRNDMINILMEVKKGQLTHEHHHAADTDAGFATVEESTVGRKQHEIEWSDTDLVAQAGLFLFAGFDTVSTSMSFLLHELALNPDVQGRLAQEIKEHDERQQGKFDFNSIQHMTYLDMVVSEGLRLWPGAPIMDRQCIKTYNAGKVHDKATKDLIINKGDVVNIPIYGFHRSPELFPNPDKFDPERFSEENRSNIKPFSYMPFGTGPRNCIGSRFALCEIKVMLYQLLRDIEVCPSEKTCIPTKLTRDGFNLNIRGGAWLRLKIRK